jgi:uncharacterized protein (TIGR01777 family)
MKRIILAGGSGFLGRALAEHFQTTGHDVVILTRSPRPSSRGTREVAWDARTIGDCQCELEGALAVINLAGRTVNCRYHRANPRLILDSRVFSTQILGQAIAQCQQPPRVWLNSSTATIYRHTFGPAWDEGGEIGGTSEAKDEFSVEVARAWEQALNEAQTPNTRKVALRAAIFLGGDKNSVFPMLCRLAQFGLGGKMGSGKQFVSWIHEDDFCRAAEWLITHEKLEGPVNICAPNLVSNEEMTKTFREVLSVPIGLPAAKWMLEMGAVALRTETELILKSRRVVPRRLIESGFMFGFPFLHQALDDLQVSSKIK